MGKSIRIACDFITALLLVVFVFSITSCVTIGSASFYNGYYSKSEVTDKLKENVVKGNRAIAEQTGIELGAFDYALDKNIDIDKIKMQIPSSIFNGVNANYSQSENIDGIYRDSIVEYYNINGLSLDNTALEKAVNLASEEFNNSLGADNMTELSGGVKIVSTNAKICAIASLAALVFFVSRIFALSLGRTRTFSHIGSVLISAGSSFVTMFCMNTLVGFVEKLDISSNPIIVNATIYGVDRFFTLLLIVGIIFIVLGLIAMRFVYDYYRNKFAYQLEEKMINEKIRDDAQKASVSVDNID